MKCGSDKTMETVNDDNERPRSSLQSFWLEVLLVIPPFFVKITVEQHRLIGYDYFLTKVNKL
jgi:hypothetical protein